MQNRKRIFSRKLFGVALLGIVANLLSGCASTTAGGTIGIDRQQILLVSAEFVESAALSSYNQQNQTALSQKRLITTGEEYRRLTGIASRLKNHVGVFRQDAARWTWQVALIDSQMLNATCAPGGKITFYTGLIRKLRLSDDEIAAVMGHEIAHALREHGRERLSQQLGVQAATLVVSASSNSAEKAKLVSVAAQYLYMMPNSREHESEADRMGLELAARAGYNPAAAANVWRKMIAL